MCSRPLPYRFRSLPEERVLGHRALVADRWPSRLLGLAILPRRRAPEALLLPGCKRIHTFGMRFGLEIVFLDRHGEVVRRISRLSPRRFASCRDAVAVLEIPTSRGG